MKKMLICAALILALTSCTNEQKAHRLIRQYMKENLNDYSGYAPVKLYLNDKDHYIYETDSKVGLHAQRAQYLEKDFFQSHSKRERNKIAEKYKAQLDTIRTRCREIDSLEHRWSALLEYRAKNGFGAQVKRLTIFVMDGSFGSILYSETQKSLAQIFEIDAEKQVKKALRNENTPSEY